MERLTQMHRAFSIVAAGAVLALVAGCGSSNNASGNSTSTSKSGSGPAHKGQANTLNWNNNTGDVWVKTLDPALVTDSVSIADIEATNANLVKADYPSLKIIPDLATWKSSADHKTWTFTIRANARFSDGNPVTAADAAWSIQRSLDPATKSPVATTYLGHIVGATDFAAGKTKTLPGVKATGPKTLQITLDEPIAYFLGALSYPTAEVLEKSKLQGKPVGAYLTNDCSANVGAGPFKFVCLNNSTSIHSFYAAGTSPYMKMVPNPYYFGKKPTIKIYAPFMTDLETNWKQYQAGAVDITGVPTADIAIAQKMPGFVKTPLLDTDYITANELIPPFNNINCRLAVSYGIDRETITTKLLRGTEGPLYDVLPPGLPGYFGKSSDVPSYNPTKAKAYLAKCPGHLSNVSMTYQKTSADLTHEYDAIAYGLKQIGANVTLKGLPFNAWLKVVGGTMMDTRNQEQITENLWIDDYADPQDWLDNLLTSTANYDIGGFKNAQYDALVKQANAEFNPAKRAQLYIQAAKIAVNQGAWIGVGYGIALNVISPHVHGMVSTASLVQPQGNDWSNVSIS